MKKSNILKSILFGLTATALLSSCGKYEEGPNASLTSKEARLRNKWTLESQTINGNPVELSASDKDDVMEFRKGNLVTYTDPTTNPALTHDGAWTWAKDKEAIVVTVSQGIISATETYDIKRLTRNELWFEYTDADGDLYYDKYEGND